MSQLFFEGGLEEFAHAGAGFEAEGFHDVFAGEEGRGERGKTAEAVVVSGFDLVVEVQALGRGAHGVGVKKREQRGETRIQKPLALFADGHVQELCHHEMVLHGPDDFVHVFAGKTQAAQDAFAELSGNFAVVVEANAFGDFKRFWFADVVQNHGPMIDE